MASRFLKRFIRSDTGAAMVEYAIALLVAAALGTGVFTVMGNTAKSTAEDACQAMGNTAADCGVVADGN